MSVDGVIMSVGGAIQCGVSVVGGAMMSVGGAIMSVGGAIQCGVSGVGGAIMLVVFETVYEKLQKMF